MKKPILDEFDRWFLKSNTSIGKTIKRKYKIKKIMKKLGLLFGTILLMQCTPSDDLPQPVSTTSNTPTPTTNDVEMTLGIYKCNEWEAGLPQVRYVDTLYVEIEFLNVNKNSAHVYSYTSNGTFNSFNRNTRRGLIKLSDNFYDLNKGSLQCHSGWQLQVIDSTTIKMYEVISDCEKLDTLQSREFYLMQ